MPAGAQGWHRQHGDQHARGRHSTAGGTGAANGQIGRPAAGKTGTTDQHYDAWFDGYIPQLAAAVWVGDGRNPTLYPMEYPGYIAPGQTVSTVPDGTVVGGVQQGMVFGGDLPTRVWAATLRAASANLPIIDFPPADLSVEQGVSALVPNVAGMDVASATAALSAAGFTPIDGGGAASGNTPGTVAFTTPAGGFQAPQGSGVTIFTSTGLPPPPPTKAPVTKKPVAKTPVVKPSVKVKAPKH